MRNIAIAHLSRAERLFVPNRIARAHVLRKLEKPDPDSIFAKWTAVIRWLPNWLLLPLLFAKNYNALVFLQDDADDVVGEIFCQGHKDGLHLFHIELHPTLRGTGASLSALDDFVRHAWSKGWRRVRLGQDKDETEKQRRMKKLRERYYNTPRNDLPCRVVPGNGGYATLAAA